jgi:hypothetical protein
MGRGGKSSLKVLNLSLFALLRGKQKNKKMPNEPNFENQSRKQKSFFAKQTQFPKSGKCPNFFSYSWLLKAGGWPLSKKQTQTKPISKVMAPSLWTA